jgi:DNA-binding NarL/FixJ family response regulator
MGPAAHPSGPGRRLRVLVAERHPNVRAALRADLEDVGFEVCAEAADPDAAVAAARDEQPDVCLVDASFRDGAATLVARLLAEEAAPRVVVLAVTRDEEALVAAFRAGAVGYLPKDVQPERLRDALLAVAEGATVVPPSLARRFRGAGSVR